MVAPMIPDHSWLFIYVEQYGPEEIERACSMLWGEKGEKRYKKLLETLRNQREIMQRMAVVTSSNTRPGGLSSCTMVKPENITEL